MTHAFKKLPLVLTAAILVYLMLGSTNASAATVQISGAQLQVTDGASASQLDISELLGIYFFSGTATAGSGCIQVTATDVTCPGLGLTSYSADLGANSDTFRFQGNPISLPGVVLAGDGDDVIVGNTATEEIHGGLGNDFLAGTGGADQLYGEDGDDQIGLGLGTAGENLSGGPGSDIVSAGLDNPMTISLDDVANDGALPVGTAMVSSDFEDVYGGAGSDILEGDSGPNQIRTRGGSDVLRGLDGDDFLRGGGGEEAVDVVQMFGGDGTDYLEGGVGSDDMQGELGNDVLVPSTGTDQLQGGSGTDVANYAAGQHTVPLSLSIGDGANDGAPGENDNIAADIETIYGGPAADIIVGDSSPNNLLGFGGADQISGLGGDDTLDGDDIDSAGADTLLGGSGSDILLGENGDDLLDGGSQADVLNGGAGVDTADYSTRTNAVVVTLSDGQSNDGEVGEGDQVITENVTTGSGADQITGSLVANTLVGNDGNDLFHATDGVVDQVDCGPGTDNADDSDVIDVLTSCEVAAPPVQLETQITSGPAGGSTIITATTSFSFNSPNDPGGSVVSFECSLDLAPYAACSSPEDVGPLAEGSHSFAVRAVSGDPGYLTDSTPATRSFTVDLPTTNPPTEPSTVPVDPGTTAPPTEVPVTPVSPVADPLDRCALRTARARVFVYTEQNKIRLVIRYKSKHRATVAVSYKAKTRSGSLSLGKAKAKFKKKGLYRLELQVSQGKMNKIRDAKSFTASMKIPGEPSYCARAYERKITKRRVVAGQIVYFQANSTKITLPKKH